MCQIRLSREK